MTDCLWMSVTDLKPEYFISTYLIVYRYVRGPVSLMMLFLCIFWFLCTRHCLYAFSISVISFSFNEWFGLTICLPNDAIMQHCLTCTLRYVTHIMTVPYSLITIITLSSLVILLIDYSNWWLNYFDLLLHKWHFLPDT